MSSLVALSRGLSQVPNRTVLRGDMGPRRETFLVVAPWVGAAAGRMPLAPERQRSRTPRASRQPRDQEPSWPHVTCARWRTPLVLFTLRLPTARSPRPDAPVAFGGDGPGALINGGRAACGCPLPRGCHLYPALIPLFSGFSSSPGKQACGVSIMATQTSRVFHGRDDQSQENPR